MIGTIILIYFVGVIIAYTLAAIGNDYADLDFPGILVIFSWIPVGLISLILIVKGIAYIFENYLQAKPSIKGIKKHFQK